MTFIPARLGKISRKAKKISPARVYQLTRGACVILVRDGVSAVLGRLKQKILETADSNSYADWIEKYDTLSEEDRRRIRAQIEKWEYKPLISIIMPTYNSQEDWFRRALQTVCDQIYPHWELCIADDCSTQPRVREILEEFRLKDSRIRVHYRTENGHISASSNSALEMATGEFCALMDHDDEIPPHALSRIVEELNHHPDADLLYSDEDKMHPDGLRFGPYFKSDWNPDLFYTQNFINHLGVYRTSILKEIGGFRVGFEGSQDYDMVLRFLERTRPERIRHIPQILYHWRAIPGSVAFASAEKPYAHAAARRAIQAHLDRLGVNARVVAGYRTFHRVIYPIPHPHPKVSLVIGTRDRVDLLRNFIEGVLYKTDYYNIEIVIVDNGSEDPETLAYLARLRKDARFKIIRHDAPFNFSELYNLGVRASTGSIVGILNNDLEVISSDWMAELVGHALRPEVGAVGAKLLYADHRVQHAGILLGIGGIAGHPHRLLPEDHPGYAGKAQITQCVSAVTGACIFLRREVFDEVGGLDETNLPIAFNDVDFCLRVSEKNYRVIWTPYAKLLHLESATRGPDTSPEKAARLEREAAFMRKRWGSLLVNDPYYNPNLTLENESMSLAKSPRVSLSWRTEADANPS